MGLLDVIRELLYKAPVSTTRLFQMLQLIENTGTRYHLTLHNRHRTNNNEADDATPTYPPKEIDYTTFEPPSPADARSPCPLVNALCNHHLLPHDGKNITKQMAVDALVQAVNLDPGTAAFFAAQAITTNPDHTAHSFDLDHLASHGNIEHDVSLSRNDAGFGDNASFDHEIWAQTVAHYGAATETSIASVSKARYERVKASRRAHEAAGLHFTYSLREFVASYGESSLFLNVLGAQLHDGRIPLDYVRVLFEENRLPYKEGWRKVDRPIGQMQIQSMILKLFEANDEKFDEAVLIQLGTVNAVRAAAKSIMPSSCSVM